jgi:hypothetical protein
MKLSWRNIVTTLLAGGGAALVYAKYYDYSWAVIGSWRSAVAALAGVGAVMFLFSAFDFRNFSILGVTEMLGGLAALGLAVAGVIVTSSVLFYTLAGVLGALWLVDTARDTWHSLVNNEATTFHHHAPVH